MNKPNFGKLIVIDGVDGSNKKVQTELLVDRLKKIKLKAICLNFPQYSENFFGKLLRGALSAPKEDFLKNDPKTSSVFFALDRFESKGKILEYLEKGYFVVVNNYVTSSLVRQSAKFIGHKNEKEMRLEMKNFIETMEYKIFRIPKPDLIIFLDLKLQTVEGLLKNKSGQDLMSLDLAHQKLVIESAHKLFKEMPNIKAISCDDEDFGVKGREGISNLIFEQVKKYL